jgi:hypothetical protein
VFKCNLVYLDRAVCCLRVCFRVVTRLNTDSRRNRGSGRLFSRRSRRQVGHFHADQRGPVRRCALSPQRNEVLCFARGLRCVARQCFKVCPRPPSSNGCRGEAGGVVTTIYKNLRQSSALIKTSGRRVVEPADADRPVGPLIIYLTVMVMVHISFSIAPRLSPRASFSSSLMSGSPSLSPTRQIVSALPPPLHQPRTTAWTAP